MIRPRAALGAFVLLCFAFAAQADYEKGMAALQRRDAAAAFKELRAAAEAGDERAFAPLASLYLRGTGTQRDMRAAQGWAAKAAAKGSADAQFMLYGIIISNPALNFVDAQGRIDEGRYRALAARPISDREDEMTAYDNLGKAAEQNHRNALLSLAGFLGDNVGEGNRGRALAILDKQAQRPPPLEELYKRLAVLDAIGPTLALPRIADDLRAAAAKTAVAAAAEKDPSKQACSAVKPVRAQRMGPVTRPIWLPLAVPELKTAYLMSGEWRERWTFDVCGAESVVVVLFAADGLGSATFTVEKQR
jgi:TPR repeat protein